MISLPKVSILIPTYRQQECISKAISSALDQNYPNLEIIVVDDASPDNTAEKVAEFEDSRLRYVRNTQNIGRVKNYRHGLYELASGEWFINLDGDDYFTDVDFISKAVELAYSQSGIVIVAARRNVAMATGIRAPLPLETTVLSGQDTLLRYHDRRYHFSHMATLYHRPSALACDFYRLDVISSDWESLLRLALTGNVAYLDRVIGCWTLHNNNASNNNCWQNLVRNLVIWESIYSKAASVKIPHGTLRKARNANLLTVAHRDLYQIFKGGGVSDAFIYLLKGFRVLKAAVVVRIVVHPYIWAKLTVNIYMRIIQRIS